ncbi:MAG: bifunctional DNA-formamidopyrimidine glycosylase/DNA-(apurinic or apyrimidinic site) lyase [Planctomycetes bacterium]|nr:bifunctional DNA-formamidopyrimidine glycosylase/DNA-(apurinic or apyrimidinic site) lyase [Planctomycetota bacterium]
MPELPEAETIARGLHKNLRGIKIVSLTARAPKLRNDLDEAKMKRDLCGKKVKKVYRRGKAVLVEMEDKTGIIIQLGMTGACKIVPKEQEFAKHEHVIFYLSNKKTWRFEDHRRFGMIETFNIDKPETWPDFLNRLGPEPLSDDFDGKYLFDKSRDRKCSIKDFILNQEIVAGVGNIYASEVLLRAKVRPDRHAGKITRKEADLIAEYIKLVLAAAIEAGGTTISDYKDVDGTEGKFVRELKVYGREGEKCHTCGKDIKMMVLGGRSSFYCPKCQK